MIRQPVVAGQFYSGSPDSLKREIENFTPKPRKKIDAKGVVSPHAGYLYSGTVAGEVLSAVFPKPTYVILGPNHTGLGKAFGMDLERSWKTPLGEARTDRDLGNAILEESKYVEIDSACHDREHSIEVQLPFLQHLGKFRFVPIVVSLANGEIYREIGRGIARAIQKTKKETLIVASSDMTHYETQDSAKKKDRLAIDKILKLDIAGLLETVSQNGISMCGLAPVAIMLEAALELGAKGAKLIKYATSGDVSGDYSAVVGYAGIGVY
ncbi:MAG: AmmeMemoRadiSam system protein B [Candidatus Omnitrophica bacterium]|nr:AmmeMemoRadiSam system protein B [Candidatus Omnitrophota bacterium]